MNLEHVIIHRRRFILGAGTSLAALAGLPSLPAAGDPRDQRDQRAVKPWTIGCFNRAWASWSLDDTLKGIREAGYEILGLVSPQGSEAFASKEATPEYLKGLKRRIEAAGLKLLVTALRFDPAGPLEDLQKDVHVQIENAAVLKAKYVMTFGVDQEKDYDKFHRLMSDAAARAEKLGIQVVIKPHGGISAGAEEILRCLEKVGHANFKVWYDAGNILHYTGKDPALEAQAIAKHVTGFCAKDCAGPRGEVMMQLGAGKVDFKAVLGKLKAAGFQGPILVEGIKVGATPPETTANARANRELLERVVKIASASASAVLSSSVL